jgi:hypothetical protein
MIGKLAVRSLTAHPVRSAVLAAGFGAGVSVMAILLGVAEVVLDQARSPALVGGGDVLISPAPQVPARLLLAGTLQSDALRGRVRAASPWHTSPLYLLAGGRSVQVDARGGIPSLERALGDPETAAIAEWRDSPADVAWTNDTPDRVLRYIDRFHPIPNAPDWSASWAEWLYFNGRASGARFYLTFLVGPVQPDGRRTAGVRLQLERDGMMTTFSESASIAEADALRAPDLAIGSSFVRLEGLEYRIHVELVSADGRRARGDLVIGAAPGRWVPPLEIAGARGWRSGYVVPVMAGTLRGALEVGGARVPFDDGVGYHDHNWGFWQGVSWQWGQVQHDALSIVFGRVFPPPEAADPERVPGFVVALGPDGPLGYATRVSITETNDARGQPLAMAVDARSRALDVALQFSVGSLVTTRMGQAAPASGLDLLQLRGEYVVKGRAGDQPLDFTAPGSAETFRGHR